MRSSILRCDIYQSSILTSIRCEEEVTYQSSILTSIRCDSCDKSKFYTALDVRSSCDISKFYTYKH